MNTKEITETIRGLNRSGVKNKEELIESFCCDILEEQDKDTFAEDFQKGRESVLRHNESGCCCLFNEEEEIVSICDAHKEYFELSKSKDTASKILKHLIELSDSGLWEDSRVEIQLNKARDLLKMW